MTILTVARNTFREHIRDKILYNLILFALVMILSSLALGQLTLGHEQKVIIDLGLASISIFGTLIAVFIGISLVYKELEKRTIYALLSKPVHRHEFILGKYLGLLGTLLVNVVIMTAGLIVTLMYHGGMGFQEYLRLIPGVYLIFLSLALTTALALLFSTFSTPALSALFTIFLWVIGHFNGDLLEFSRMPGSAAAQTMFRFLYYALPNLSNYTMVGGRNVIQSAAYGQAIDPMAVLWVTVYSLLYCFLLLSASIVVFSRRDFK